MGALRFYSATSHGLATPTAARANSYCLTSAVPHASDRSASLTRAKFPAMFALARRLLAFMARALGQPPNLFEPCLKNPVATHRMLHFWPLRDFWSQIGSGMHTDYGLLTILKQDNVGGLHVLNVKDARWVHAVPIPGAFVVNIGDMLSRWTGQQFKATVHRVVTIAPTERFSVPYYLAPSLDTIILPGEIASPSPAYVSSKGNSKGNSGKGKRLIEHKQRCRQRQRWSEMRNNTTEAQTAERILSEFYSKSGMFRGSGEV
eukprot:NODE_4355_length_1902_cov_4.714930.p2 GENE.NODE_4355_length_1902_cov_4.714930~~NODE_4355_length_1902_cov_4.714930.p2  ORF type:complete len:261 (+),score=43.12 NODE_4355_length_1902_cov_4.714930:467-1249(+)